MLYYLVPDENIIKSNKDFPNIFTECYIDGKMVKSICIASSTSDGVRFKQIGHINSLMRLSKYLRMNHDRFRYVDSQEVEYMLDDFLATLFAFNPDTAVNDNDMVDAYGYPWEKSSYNA